MKVAGFKEERHVYWEKQGFDRLCGVHCLNSLLQGPFFDASSLAEVGRALDLKEQAVVGRQLAESSNVSMDGNYSIQVLCLGNYGLSVDSADSLISRSEDLSAEEGFICNSHEHWFSLRKIRGVWYNLNSTNRNMPEIISDFYFSAFLVSVREGGYHVFVVRGAFPASDSRSNPAINRNQLWVPEQAIRQNYDRRVKAKNYVPNIGAEDEASVEEAQRRAASKQGQDEYDMEQSPPKKEQKVDPFQGRGAQMPVEKSGATDYQNYIKIDPQEDPETYFQFMEELQAKFVGRGGGHQLQFRLGDSVLQQAFWEDAIVEDLYDFAQANMPFGLFPPCEEFVLFAKYPTRELRKTKVRISEAELQPGETLYVRGRG